jgi:hypothetical protein
VNIFTKTGLFSNALNALWVATVAQVVTTVPHVVQKLTKEASLQSGPAHYALAFKDFTKIQTIPKAQPAFNATSPTALLATVRQSAQSVKTSCQGLD